VLALYLSSDGQDFQSSAGYEEHLFNGLHGPWDSDDFSDILIAHTGRPVSEGGLGHPMGLADIRHLLIGVMRKNCKRLVADLDLEHYFDEQSGHQGEVARGYAVDHSYVQSVSSDHLLKFVALSRAHHALLFPPATPIIPASPSRILSSVNTQPVDFTSWSRVISPYLSISMLPIIHHAIADGMAVCSPFARPSVNISPINQLPTGQPAKETLVPINACRFRDLRALMGPQAVFQSREQAEAVEVLMGRRVHAVIMLGWRENRSLFYLLPAVCPDEASLTSVVVLPGSDYVQALKAQFDQEGLSAVIWSPEFGNHGARAVLVCYESLESTSFWTSLENAKGSLSRIIVGQAEHAFQSWEYQCAIANCERLQWLKLPIILLTYTMALAAAPKLMAYFKMDPNVAQLCRGHTDLRNICFSAFEAPLSSELEGLLSICLNKSLRDLTTETELILVICPTEDEADRMATIFSKDVIHAHLAQDRIATILQGWSTSRGDRRILFSSTALPPNVTDIRVVIHYHEPSNFIRYADALALLCRDDRPSYSFIFFTPDARPKSWDGDEPEAQLMGAGDVSRWLRERACRRLALSSFFGFEQSGRCLDTTICQICDVCEETLQPLDNVSTKRFRTTK
jgi:superfamily II DNA helicase RecQ